MTPYSEPDDKVFQEYGKDQDPKIKLFHCFILFQRESTSLLCDSTQILPKNNRNKKMSTL